MSTNQRQDEGGGNGVSDDTDIAAVAALPTSSSPNKQRSANISTTHTDYLSSEYDQQPLDVFVRHMGLQQQQQSERERRPSLPTDAIELPTLSGVVMRRKQQLQLRYQNQQQQQQQPQQTIASGKHLSPLVALTRGGRPLSISSVSSAASSGSSSSAHSSASSGIQSSLTRNGSLNYGHEYRKCAYLASIESLNSPTGCSATHANNSSSANLPLPTITNHAGIEVALKNLSLSSGSATGSSARAAILAAGAQSRGFAVPGSRISRINRSLHASLRYDKNTAYRIHLMANARALANNRSNNTQQLLSNHSNHQNCEDDHLSRGGSISRNNSSTSSDSGHHSRQLLSSATSSRNSRYITCRCDSIHSITSSSSAPQVDQQSDRNEDKDSSSLSSTSNMINSDSNKAATLDSGSCQRSIKHHPDCSYFRSRPKRASNKLQPSPSSASSHSNTSSLYRDDGFEDDMISTASEQLSTYLQHHRLSFQGHNQARNQYLVRCAGAEDDDEYQSCEEGEFAASQTTASTTSNLDDCALSTTSSMIHKDHHLHQPILDQVTLANAKQQYRKSLLLEHQQQQHLLQQHQHSGQTRIQSLLLSSSPKICHIGALSPKGSSANVTSASSANSPPNSKQTNCDDRTVNIIGHMPTRSPGYWDSNLSITQRVVTEIIETERTYVDDLEQIVTGYICYLRNVLKQQKHQQNQIQKQQQQQQQQQSHENLSPQQKLCSSNNINPKVMVSQNTDDDDKSMHVFDDDARSTMNEVDDYDVEEADNEIGLKENVVHNITNKQIGAKHETTNTTSCTANTTKTTTATTINTNTTTDGAIMTASHIKKLFINLEDIYKFNKDLLFRLEECYLNPSSVAECFVENAPGFEIYTHYCTMYPQVVSTLTELMANQTSAQLLKERQNELNQSLPLGAYLLKPVQRILKYHILFQSLIKHTADDEAVDEKDRQLINEAFSVMTSIACHINAMKKRHEHAIRVQEVQGLLSGWEGPDLTTLGELILEDTFKLYNRSKTNRHLFLFDSVLLITKKKRDGSLCYKGHIACSNLMLIENIEGQPLVFNTVPFDNPKALCAFQAKNLDKKRDWCMHMKEVIIKSFEVEIPGHVKDILMSLTNSNSASSGAKSTFETPRALRAPNYLEKKRTKLDKKK